MSTALAAAPAFDLAAAPMRIAAVRLRVRDLDRVSMFYREVIGLEPIGAAAGRATLGVAGAPILELAGDPGLAPVDPHEAGLFHTAFRVPGRADLARWLAHARARRVALDGASDHAVSEAIYLTDPEGNGVEVYADRPPSLWRPVDGRFDLPSTPLDLRDLLGAAGGGAWTGMPAGGTVGHVHLQVGDTAAAERFYGDVLGLGVTCRIPAATFFGIGGYHHQLAANIWNSAGAGPRPARAAGLDEVRIAAAPAIRAAVEARARETGIAVAAGDGAAGLRDPWGTAITLVDG